MLLLDLGRVEHERGHYAQGEEYYQECLKVARRFGYEELCGVAQNYLGQITLKQGRFLKSRRYLQDALTLLRRIGSDFWRVEVLLHLGHLAGLEGDEQQAEESYQEALDIAQRFEHRGNLGALFEALGKLETRRGNYTRAESFLRDALQIGRELGFIPLVCLALYSWGELYLRRQCIDEAWMVFEEMRITVPAGECEVQALALYGLARTAQARRDLPTARQQGEASLAIFAAIGHYRANEVRDWLEQKKSSGKA